MSGRRRQQHAPSITARGPRGSPLTRARADSFPRAWIIVGGGVVGQRGSGPRKRRWACEVDSTALPPTFAPRAAGSASDEHRTHAPASSPHNFRQGPQSITVGNRGSGTGYSGNRVLAARIWRKVRRANDVRRLNELWKSGCWRRGLNSSAGVRYLHCQHAATCNCNLSLLPFIVVVLVLELLRSWTVAAWLVGSD